MILGEGDGRDDRQIRDGPDGLHGQAQLLEIGEGLDHEGIHAAFEQPFRLLAKGRPGFLGRDRPQRGEVLPEGADGAEHEDVAPERLAHVPRQLDAAQIDLAHLRGQAVDAQLEAVGAEGIGLDPVGARLDVLGVNALDDLGLVDVQHVEAGIQRHAAGIQHGAHGAVAQQRAFPETLDEGRAHLEAVG